MAGAAHDSPAPISPGDSRAGDSRAGDSRAGDSSCGQSGWPLPGPYSPLDDPTLIARIRGGDRESMSILLSRYERRMFGLCYRIVNNRDMAADLCQDAMVKLLQGLSSYDGRAQFTTWMTRIVINVCLSKLRSEKLRRAASLDSSADESDQDGPGPGLSRSLSQEREPDARRSVQDREGRRVLSAALASLDPEQRTILLLRDQRGLDYEQIGDVMAVAVGTVKSRLFRARAALREAMERLAPGDGPAGKQGSTEGK